MSKKQILLPWSGGFDSTTLLFHYLITKDYDVTTTFFSIDNSELKDKKQLVARRAIKKYIKSRYNKTFKDLYIDLGEVKNSHHPSNYWQPFFWINGLLHSLSDEKSFDEAPLGFLQGADFWCVHTEFEKAFQALANVLLIGKRFPDQSQITLPNITYPFMFLNKRRVFEKFVKGKFEDILKLCWTCETEENLDIQCGDCLPCRNYINFLLDIKRPELVKKLFSNNNKERI